MKQLLRNYSNKTLAYSVTLLILGVGLLVIFNFNNDQNSSIPTDDSPSLNITTLNPEILIIGDPKAKVTIVEYADFKCPQCAEFYNSAGHEIRKNYIEPGLAKIEFRPFPVFAEDGAKALLGGYCAQEQAKFTNYHDAIFSYMWTNHFKQKDYQKAIDIVLTDPVMDQIMRQVGIDIPAFRTCLDSKKYETAYFRTIDQGSPDGIQGTPSFIINGQKIVGNQPYNVYKTLIDLAAR